MVFNKTLKIGSSSLYSGSNSILHLFPADRFGLWHKRFWNNWSIRSLILCAVAKEHSEEHSRGPPQNEEVSYEPFDDGRVRERINHRFLKSFRDRIIHQSIKKSKSLSFIISSISLRERQIQFSGKYL